MKILLFGKNGQVGWELQRSLAPLGEVVAVTTDSAEYCGDLSAPERLADTVRRLRPDVIVNAAAYTAVDRAESEPERCRAINALAPGLLAREAAALGSWLVHYSSDYVFDGSGERPRRETDPPAPLNVYGATKLEAEEAICASGCRHLIFRTSWVYAARGTNFARTMLRLARERERLTVIDDQIGAPTGAELIADVTAQALRILPSRPDLAGLYHLAAAGEVSWYGYACLVVEFARSLGESLAVGRIDPIPTCEFPTPAARPHNSRLDTAKLQSAFGLSLPHWRLGVERMLTEILER